MRSLEVLLLLAVSTACQAQSNRSESMQQLSQSEVSFQFERTGLPVPKFELTVREDGSGTYKGEIAVVSNRVYGGGSPTPGQKIDRTIKLTPTTTEMIFKAARALEYFNVVCASKAKNIADTGKKTLSYIGADGHGSCLYNYSENKAVTQLTETLQAIAFTMDEGRKLDFLHRFDRLGLYSEIDALKHEVEAKRALELGNISQSLSSIANDEALIERVREHAVSLLNLASDSMK